MTKHLFSLSLQQLPQEQFEMKIAEGSLKAALDDALRGAAHLVLANDPRPLTLEQLKAADPDLHWLKLASVIATRVLKDPAENHGKGRAIAEDDNLRNARSETGEEKGCLVVDLWVESVMTLNAEITELEIAGLLKSSVMLKNIVADETVRKIAQAIYHKLMTYKVKKESLHNVRNMTKVDQLMFFKHVHGRSNMEDNIANAESDFERGLLQIYYNEMNKKPVDVAGRNDNADGDEKKEKGSDHDPDTGKTQCKSDSAPQQAQPQPAADTAADGVLASNPTPDVVVEPWGSSAPTEGWGADTAPFFLGARVLVRDKRTGNIATGPHSTGWITGYDVVIKTFTVKVALPRDDNVKTGLKKHDLMLAHYRWDEKIPVTPGGAYTMGSTDFHVVKDITWRAIKEEYWRVLSGGEESEGAEVVRNMREFAQTKIAYHSGEFDDLAPEHDADGLLKDACSMVVFGHQLANAAAGAPETYTFGFDENGEDVGGQEGKDDDSTSVILPWLIAEAEFLCRMYRDKRQMPDSQRKNAFALMTRDLMFFSGMGPDDEGGAKKRKAFDNKVNTLYAMLLELAEDRKERRAKEMEKKEKK